MSATYRAWQAGFVRRWHTNFDLCDTIDCDAGHQNRVCILILKLFPDASRALLVRAMTHDQGEVATGDVPYDAKRANPALRRMVSDLEDAEIDGQGLPQPDITDTEAQALKLCDWLDAWLWMMRHRPHLSTRADWQAQLTAMIEAASSLGVSDLVASPVGSALAAVRFVADGVANDPGFFEVQP